MWLMLLFMCGAAKALPPFPECREFLIPPEALHALGRVIEAHPGYDRAFVGHLTDFWQTDDKRFVYWNIYDRHNEHKVFARRDAYVHTLHEGDHLELFDLNWRSIGGGAFTTTDQGFRYRDLSGFTTLPTRAKFATWNGVTAAPPEPESYWLNDQGRAIVLSRMNATDRSEWVNVDAPVYQEFLRARSRPRYVRGRNFELLLGHFERAHEVKIAYEPFDQNIARLTLIEETIANRPTKREMIYLFDQQDQFIDRARAFNDHGGVILWTAANLESSLERLRRATRVVVVRRIE